MNIVYASLISELKTLTETLIRTGWQRSLGARMIVLVQRIQMESNPQSRPEIYGRAKSLVGILTEFLHEPPNPERLNPVLDNAQILANLLGQETLLDLPDLDYLPANPQEWTFVFMGEPISDEARLCSNLETLGLRVLHVINYQQLKDSLVTKNAVFIARADWLTTHAVEIQTWLPTQSAGPLLSPMIVASDETGEISDQIYARQAGARLLLTPPLETSHLIVELAGLAWMPRRPYRILLVDDDSSILQFHNALLKNLGFEILATSDPLEAWTALAEFSPEVCILDIEMPVCRGPDLTTVLRREKRFARLPVLYLSAFDDLEYQLDACQAGGEEYLMKSADPRRLKLAALTKARQFRLWERLYFQRRDAWRELTYYKRALDAHAIVSVTGADGAIYEVNQKFCEISGFQRDDLLGSNHRITRSGHHPQEFFAQLWRTINSGQIWEGEIQNRRKDGHSYWVKSTIAPILDDRGNIEHFIAIRTDITEQKQILAEHKRQTRLLNLLRKVLQNFLINQDIVIASSLMLEELPALTDSIYGLLGEVRYDEKNQPYLKTHAISNITWDTQTQSLLADVKAQGMEFRNLENLFGKILSTGEIFILNDLNEFHRSLQLPAGHPRMTTFLGVPIRYEGVLIGLLGLANRLGGYDHSVVEFLEPLITGYAHLLEASRRRDCQQRAIDDLQHNNKLTSNTKLKLNNFLNQWIKNLQEPLNNLFNLIKQLQQKPEQQKTLAAYNTRIYNLLQELNLELEHNPEHVNSSSSVNFIQEMTPKSRILVAEDGPANQVLLRMQLEVLGYEVGIAADGKVALEQWKTGHYDLILTDLNMPVMDGFDLTRSIRAAESESGQMIPILAITALDQEEIEQTCLNSGMNAILPKPFQLEDLRQALTKWIKSSTGLNSNPELIQLNTSPQESQASLVNLGGATLDLEYMSNLIGDVNQEQRRILLDLFTTTSRADLSSSELLLEHGRIHDLAFIMHKIKSSARMVGALRFATLAERIEELLEHTEIKQAKILLKELEHALDDVERLAQKIESGSAIVYLNQEEITPEQVPQRVLVVDDDALARRQLGFLLTSLGVREVLTVEDAHQALIELERDGAKIDLLITDLHMPEMDGIEFQRRLSEHHYQGAVILCSGVEDQVLQSALTLGRVKGLQIWGALHKPIARNDLMQLFNKSGNNSILPISVTIPEVLPENLLDGLRNNEFQVHYQPKADASTLRVLGLEALARWERAGQTVPTDLFITAAERYGLIASLSKQLLTKALLGCERISAAGFPLSLAFNLSANWLADVHLPEFILASLQAIYFPPERLILEITETGVIADLATSLDILTRLRLKGFKLSIDDFGTGYSSMEQLQRIPFSEIKLDRSFVQNAHERPAARAILASSIEIARKLKLMTVAEGVETQKELDLIRGLGCDCVQGWFVAKAMPAEALIHWLQIRL